MPIIQAAPFGRPLPSYNYKMCGSRIFGDQLVGKEYCFRKHNPSSQELGDKNSKIQNRNNKNV